MTSPLKQYAGIELSPLPKLTSESFSQFSKARPPSSVTFFKTILVSPDPENADCPIFVILEISIDCNDFAFKKMLSGSSVTEVSARFIFVSLNAPENAETPRVVSVSGSETSVMYSIPLNANSPISVTLPFIVRLSQSEEPLKAFAGTAVIPIPRLIFFALETPRKAPSPNEVTVSGTATAVKDLQLEKASFPIARMPEPKVRLVALMQFL